MYAQDLIEVLCAAHLTAHVRDGNFQERGGIILVAPAGALKSSMVEPLEIHYNDAVSLTDLNAKAFTALRERIASGNIRTLVFPELAKLYERKADTSANLEGALRALVAEGFKSAAFEPQGISRVAARALVIGAVTFGTRDKNIERWQESGFARRFLWPMFVLDMPELLVEAVALWRRIDFAVQSLPHAPVLGDPIPNLTTEAERRALRRYTKYQPGDSDVQQFALLVKIFAVLKWWYAQTDRARNPMEVMEAFGEALGRDGARLVLAPVPNTSAIRKRERLRVQSEAGRQLAKARKDKARKTSNRRSKRK